VVVAVPKALGVDAFMKAFGKKPAEAVADNVIPFSAKLDAAAAAEKSKLSESIKKINDTTVTLTKGEPKVVAKPAVKPGKSSRIIREETFADGTRHVSTSPYDGGAKAYIKGVSDGSLVVGGTVAIGSGVKAGMKRFVEARKKAETLNSLKRAGAITAGTVGAAGAGASLMYAANNR